MYFCIAAILEDNIQNVIRKYVNSINRIEMTSIKASLLPQHISLKISFKTDEVEKLENYFDNIQIRNEIVITSNGIELIEQSENGSKSGLIWINFNENNELRDLHNKLNNDLPQLLGIENSWIDGNNFRFHSTVLFGNKRYEEYEKVYELLKDEFRDFNTRVSKIALFCSHENEVVAGTFYQYKVRHLTTASI